MAEITKSRPAGTRGFVAVLLLTAGALLLVGRVLPIVGDALALVLGTELLVRAYVARQDGLLVAGGVTAGIGTGVLLAAGPLLGAQPHVVGAAFLLAVAGGFGLVAGLARLRWHRTWTWAWSAAAAIGALGAALLGGADGVAELFAWGLPAALIAGGVVAALRWRRA